MAKYLTPNQKEQLIPKIIEDLLTMKEKDKEKIIANKYRVKLSFVMHIAKTRKVGLLSEELKQNNVSSNTTNDIINNADVINNQIEKKEVDKIEEKEIIIKDERGNITEEAKIAIAIDYDNNNLSLSKIAEKYNISISTVNRVIDQLGCERKRKTSIIFDTEEKINKVFDMYFEEKMTQQEIADHFNCSITTICKLIKNKGYDSNMKRKKGIRNSKLNNHQIEKFHRDQQKKYEKEVEKENNDSNVEQINEITPVESPKIIEKVEDTVPSIRFANKIFKDENLVSLSNSVTVGMVSDRHNMGNLQYIFEGPITSEQFINEKWQKEVINKFIDNNFTFDKYGDATKCLVLYCTGIQIILVTILKVCIERHINVTLKHFYDKTGNYISQIAINQFNCKDEIDHPFKRLEKTGNVYLYNTKLEEITNNRNFYGISVGVHEDDSMKFKAGTCSYIFVKTEDEAWKLYPQFVKASLENSGKERNSVMLASCSTNGYGFFWEDNISKSFNFNK